MSYSGRYMLDNMVSQTKFFETRFIDTYELAKADVIHSLENPLKDYKTGEISLVRLQAKDLQTDLFARIIKPADFDPKKKYPVLYYVYGGPHAQMVQDKWNLGADLFLIYMASKGYVVFTVDNRGSGNRGFNFESATYRNLGKIEMEDQQIGINYLKKQSFVDTTRMGCFGWSFGGFMTTSMMLKKPGTFKIGVAGGPVIDWKKYEIMYTERYMDTPEQNSAGYENANLLNDVENLKGRLMIIHGLEDDTVLPEHSAAFVNKCVEKGVLIDYFPYPNHPHNVRGKDRIHLYKKIEDYFNRNL
jgi:dipeptidyl aminopeptidase/acylaminoacyl peptidase